MRRALVFACILSTLPLAGASPYRVKSNPITVMCDVNIPWLTRRAKDVDKTLCRQAIDTLQKDSIVGYWKFVQAETDGHITIQFRWHPKKVTAELSFAAKFPKGKRPVPYELLGGDAFLDGLPNADDAIQQLKDGIAKTLFNDDTIGDLNFRLTQFPFGVGADWYDPAAAELVVPLQHDQSMDDKVYRIKVDTNVPARRVTRSLISHTLRPAKKTSNFDDTADLVRQNAVITVVECAESDQLIWIDAKQVEGLTLWRPFALYLYERVNVKTMLEPLCKADPSQPH